MITFEQYLKEVNFTPRRIVHYCRTVETFLRENEKANRFQYSDLIDYLNQIGRYDISQYSRLDKYLPIKKYYDYLLDTGQRHDHPCRTLYVKAPKKKGVVFADLFSSGELEYLLHKRKEKFEAVKTKNMLIISLLIYQGLLSKEIVQLKVSHADIDSGTLYVKGGKVNTSRTLELHPGQYDILDQYLNEDRKLLLKNSSIKTDFLILNFRGKPLSTDDVNFVITSQKHLFPNKDINPKIIRDSVIANLLNEKRLPVEQVQLFAGHRWISSTARYRRISTEEQRRIMNKFHPYR